MAESAQRLAEEKERMGRELVELSESLASSRAAVGALGREKEALERFVGELEERVRESEAQASGLGAKRRQLEGEWCGHLSAGH